MKTAEGQVSCSILLIFNSGVIDLSLCALEEAISVLTRKYGEVLESISMNILHDVRDAEKCVNC